jgi:hypothetical protein
LLFQGSNAGSNPAGGLLWSILMVKGQVVDLNDVGSIPISTGIE